ncbi:MAG: GNAT family N-acetyltransferase [Anaerovoracaceae bacterium]|nr:GNAT family N-acetyltransferase [Anaerovoracaceae bacterium]
MQYKNIIKLKDGKECLIRNATAHDAEEVLALYNKVNNETNFLLKYPDEKGFSIEEEKSFLSQKEESAAEVQLCALVGDVIVGLASVSTIGAREKIRHRAELGVSIEKDYWSLGIGSALTAASIECAISAGYQQLELEVVLDNKNAIALYKKMGFIEYGRNPRGFVSRKSEYQELILMRLELR